MLDAAIADLVAVAVEERDGELGFFQPVLVEVSRKEGNGAASASASGCRCECCGFRQRFHDQPAPPAGGAPVHEGGEPLIDVAGRFGKTEKSSRASKVEQQAS